MLNTYVSVMPGTGARNQKTLSKDIAGNKVTTVNTLLAVGFFLQHQIFSHFSMQIHFAFTIYSKKPLEKIT